MAEVSPPLGLVWTNPRRAHRNYIISTWLRSIKSAMPEMDLDNYKTIPENNWDKGLVLVDPEDLEIAFAWVSGNTNHLLYFYCSPELLTYRKELIESVEWLNKQTVCCQPSKKLVPPEMKSNAHSPWTALQYIKRY